MSTLPDVPSRYINIKMVMRLATMADIPRAAEICADAFRHEPIMGYVYPGRDEYPQDWYDYWYYLIQDSILQPGQLLFVYEEPESVPGELAAGERCSQIVSVLGWRMVDDAYPNSRRLPLEKASWQERIERDLASRRMGLYRRYHPDRARADPEQFGNFMKIMAQSTKDHWSDGDAVLPHWRIVYIATNPGHQGHGYATKLLAWGMEQAEQDHLPVGVDASAAGLKLYKANGFQTLGEVHFGEIVGYICKKEPEARAV